MEAPIVTETEPETAMQPVMTIPELDQLLNEEFPQIHSSGRVFHIESIDEGELVLQFQPGDIHLRPGGTVSGPAMFTLADLAAYATILAHQGPITLAVTTNLNINFLRKPLPGKMWGHSRILKMGQRLCVTSVDILSGAERLLVAQASVTYSLPVK